MNALVPILILSFAASPVPSTALRVVQPVAAAGDVKGGPPLVRTFELVHAAANGIVTITGVEASCGCLRQNLSASVLRPEERAVLTVEVNTLTQPEGPNRWPVRIRFRMDAGTRTETGELDVVITGTVVKELTLTPPQLALSTSGEVTRTLTLTDRRPKPLTLTKAMSSTPHLVAEIGTRVNTETTITLKLAADAPAGIRDETVVLYSDDPAYPEFRVPVRVQKRTAGAATAVPEDLSLRFATGESEASSLVQVRSGDGKDVALEGVECEHPSVKAKWSTGRGRVATVRITVAGSAAPGQAEARIKLAEPAGQIIVLPVAWSAKP